MRVKLDDGEIARRRAKILELLGSLEIVEIDAMVLDRASQPMPTELGTLDAIHLVTARAEGFERVYSNDRHLLAAAKSFGLEGVNPISR